MGTTENYTVLSIPLLTEVQNSLVFKKEEIMPHPDIKGNLLKQLPWMKAPAHQMVHLAQLTSSGNAQYIISGNAQYIIRMQVEAI